MVDASKGIGNNLLIPFGPMRESLNFALKRVDIIILINSINENHQSIDCILKSWKGLGINAEYETYLNEDINEDVIIFSGISNPEKLKDPKWMKKNLPFTGELFLGHLRYGTFGGNTIEQCHPFLRQNNWKTRNLVLAGNFNMTNVDELFEQLIDIGQHPKEMADAVTILEKIGHFLDEANDEIYPDNKVKIPNKI